MNKIVIEVGANIGQDTELFLKDQNTILYAFEPVPKLAYELWKKFGKNERFHLIQAAVDLNNTFAKFNICDFADGGCSSLHDFTPNIHEKWSEPAFNYTDNTSVMCLKLDWFMETFGINQIDYLHIDAQGNDFRVLQSLGNKIVNVKSGVCEVANKIELYNIEGNTLQNVQPWLESHGFMTRVEDDGVGKEHATITGNEVNIFFDRQ